jgi:hypothetical protein
MSTTPPASRSFFDSALKVLLLTAAAYLNYFGVPVAFVDVSPHELLLGGAICLIPICLIVSLDMFWDSRPAKAPPRLSKILMTIVLMTFGVFTLCALLGVSLALTLTPIAFFIGFGAFLLVYPLIRHRQLPRIAHRYWMTYSDFESPESKQPRIFWFPVSQGVIMAIAALLITGAFASAIGIWHARVQTDFPIHDPADHCAILRLSTDGYLCVGMDFQKHAALGTFRFLDPKGVDLSVTRIGRIAPFSAPHPPKHSTPAPIDAAPPLPTSLPTTH